MTRRYPVSWAAPLWSDRHTQNARGGQFDTVTGNLCIPDCENRLNILMVAIIGFVSSSTFVTALK